MANESFDEPRQFERVLNRLDALMKRNHAPTEMPATDKHEVDFNGPETVFMELEPEVEVPVLTDVFHGAELRPVEVLENEAPPVLTQFVTEPELTIIEAAPVAVEKPVILDPAGLSEIDVEMILDELMPQLREMLARVMDEEFVRVQQSLRTRVMIEAELLLRHRLEQEIRPK